MLAWSTKRKLLYFGIFSAFVFLIVVFPIAFLSYDRPTCFDGNKNGDEVGVDCGGSCQLLCSFEAIAPNILWSRSFKVAPNLYSATAYVENSNISSEAVNVPYVFKLYDKQNTLIAERAGTAYIPKYRAFGIFEPNIATNGAVPARTTFEFTQAPTWNKDDTIPPEIVVREKVLSNEEIRPRVDASMENRSTRELKRIEVVAIVYDGKDNAIGASRTYVDSLKSNEAADLVFTWPIPFETQTNVCKVPADVMLVVDRSGSMASDNANPPQPLTDVKNAATLFVEQLSAQDYAGVVSYANEASSPIDSFLSSNIDAVKKAISSISIGTNGLQQTNIADGLAQALSELSSERHRNIARKVAVLLTDGMPTRPLKSGDPTYPETSAFQVAQDVKKAGVQLYTIGLGKEINAEYLASLASGPDYYFNALSSDSLKAIYEQIAVSICKDSPTSIEIIPIVLK